MITIFIGFNIISNICIIYLVFIPFNILIILAYFSNTLLIPFAGGIQCDAIHIQIGRFQNKYNKLVCLIFMRKGMIFSNAIYLYHFRLPLFSFLVFFNIKEHNLSKQKYKRKI